MERVEPQKRWSNLIFGILFLISLLLFGRIMAPFLMPVLLGGFLVVLLMPAHELLCELTRNRRALCAALSTLAVLALLIVPLAVLAYFVGREILAVLELARGAIDDPAYRDSLTARMPGTVRRYLEAAAANPKTEEAIVSTVTGSAVVLKDLLGAGTSLAVDGFLMSVSMYYFFLDGKRLYREATRLIPMERRYIDAFAKEFKDVAYAIMYGNTLTAVAQGAVGLVGLLIAGVPHPAVWAVAMVVVALIPIGGTALVWLPISIVLILAGRIPEGLFLLGWGALVVSTLDNFIRPRLCGSRMTLHPLLVFLSMFGGLAVFGMMGLLVGPLIASMFMAMVRIYRRDFLGATREAVQKLTQSSRPHEEPPEHAPAPAQGTAGA